MPGANNYSMDTQPDNHLHSLLSELKTGLKKLYRDQLMGVYLFGSYARGDQDAESDVDIIIILSHYHRYGQEIDRTGELASSLSLKYGMTLSRIFFRETDWQSMQTPLLRNVREEAVPV